MEKFAQQLRKSSTDTEVRLWLQLKNRGLGGFKFRRQHPIPPYVVDFVCLEQKLIVELDGGQHAEQTASDAKRTAFLESKGYRIIRLWNDEALKQTDAVLEEIFRQLHAPPLQGALSTALDSRCAGGWHANRNPCTTPDPLPASGARE